MQEQYQNIKGKDQHSEDFGENGSHTEIFLNKSLSAHLEVFDRLFCSKCLVNTTKLSINILDFCHHHVV
jgi:hypothetical protein